MWFESELLTAVSFVGVVVFREWIAYGSVLHWCDCG